LANQALITDVLSDTDLRGSDTDHDDGHSVHINQTNRGETQPKLPTDEYYLSSEQYKNADADLIKKYRKMRDELKRLQLQSTSSKSSSGSYGSIKEVHEHEFDMSLEQAWKAQPRFVNMTRVDRGAMSTVGNPNEVTVKVTDRIFDRVVKSSKLDHDAPVYLKGWWVVWTDPTQTVNIVGFEESYAMKKGLHFVSADAVFFDQQGSPVILHIHWAVHNPTSNRTLMSEPQTRADGHVVDSVSQRSIKLYETTPQGKPTYGTQTFTVQTYNTQTKSYNLRHFPLRMRHSLMTLPHRCPTPSDYKSYPVLHITPKNGWEPREHNDDDDPCDLMRTRVDMELGHPFTASPTPIAVVQGCSTSLAGVSPPAFSPNPEPVSVDASAPDTSSLVVGPGPRPSYTYHVSHYSTTVYLNPFEGDGSSLASCSASLRDTSDDHDSSLGEVISCSCASYRSVIDESEYHDARSDLPRKVTFGHPFRLQLDWNRLSDDDKGHNIPMDYLRSGEVDHFLSQESYVDLLGFIPHRPEFDSYVFAMREVELFRDAMADPSFL
jgi:hypothetical protein